MHDEFRIQTLVSDTGALLIRVAGELVMVNSARMSSTLADAGSLADETVIDLGQVDFIDSSGIKALLDCRRLALEQESTLRLVGVSRAVQRVLTIAGVDQVFEIEPAQPAQPAG
jgi:anti-anti-sigma factor